MDQDKKLDTLVEAVGSLATRMDKQDSKIDRLVDTVENLAIMMKNGFDTVDTRFSDMEKSMHDGFTAVKADISEIRMDIKPMDKSLENHEEEIGELKIRVNRLEDKVFVG